MWLIPAVFLVGTLARILVYYIVKSEERFTNGFEIRVYRHLQDEYSETKTGELSFHKLTKFLFHKTFEELYIVRSTRRKRRLDHTASFIDRMLLLEDGASRLIADTLQHTKYYRKKGHDPDFDSITKYVFTTNPCYNRIVGVVPINMIDDICNILPGLFIICGILGTFLGMFGGMAILQELDMANLAAAQGTMDLFLAKINLAIGSSINGILFSILFTFVNKFFSADAAYLNLVERFRNAITLLWESTKGGEIRSEEDEGDYVAESTAILKSKLADGEYIAPPAAASTIEPGPLISEEAYEEEVVDEDLAEDTIDEDLEKEASLKVVKDAIDEAEIELKEPTTTPEMSDEVIEEEQEVIEEEIEEEEIGLTKEDVDKEPFADEQEEPEDLVDEDAVGLTEEDIDKEPFADEQEEPEDFVAEEERGLTEEDVDKEPFADEQEEPEDLVDEDAPSLEYDESIEPMAKSEYKETLPESEYEEETVAESEYEEEPVAESEYEEEPVAESEYEEPMVDNGDVPKVASAASDTVVVEPISDPMMVNDVVDTPAAKLEDSDRKLESYDDNKQYASQLDDEVESLEEEPIEEVGLIEEDETIDQWEEGDGSSITRLEDDESVDQLGAIRRHSPSHHSSSSEPHLPKEFANMISTDEEEDDSDIKSTG